MSAAGKGLDRLARAVPGNDQIDQAGRNVPTLVGAVCAADEVEPDREEARRLLDAEDRLTEEVAGHDLNEDQDA